MSHTWLRVDSTRYGLGVFATRQIRKGTCIGEVTGAIYDDPDYSSDYCIDLGMPYSLEPDAPFRFLNHACSPNCELYLLDDFRAGRHGVRVYLEASRRIRPGDQLTIDYAWPAENAIQCACDSPQCRGWIVSTDERHLIGS